MSLGDANAAAGPARDAPTGSEPVGPLRDLLAAILAIAIGALALWGTGSMSSLGSVFPTTAATVLIGAAVLLALRALVLRRSRMPEARMPPRAEWWRAAATAALLLGWALLLKPLGFLVTGAVGLLVLAVIVRREPMAPRAAALHALAGAVLLVGFWLLMTQVLRLAVPSGTVF